MKLIPANLYKFVSLVDDSSGKSDENEKRFRSLINDEIWFSTPVNLNDPYEFKGLYVDYAKLEAAGITPEEIDDVKKMLEEDYVIASFTLDMEKNFPMWAYYANNHQGFCVRYRVINSKNIMRVEYKSQRTPMTEAVQKAIYNFRKMKDDSIPQKEKEQAVALQHMLMLTLIQNYYAKHESWSHESEYRIIAPYTNKKCLQGQNISVLQAGLCLDTIYIGYRCKYFERIKEIAAKLNVPCYKCQLDKKDFLICAK